MKSLFIIALATISLYAKQSLAYESIKHEELENILTEYLNEKNIKVSFQDNNELNDNIDNNEFNGNLDSNIEGNTFEINDYNNKFLYASEIDDTDDKPINTFELNDYNNKFLYASEIDDTDNKPLNTIPDSNIFFGNEIIDTPLQIVDEPQTVNEPQIINEPETVNVLRKVDEPQVVTEDSSNEQNESNTSAYVLGGVGITSVALIAAFGFKNYRKNSMKMIDVIEIEKIFDEKDHNINKPEEVKRSNTLNRLRRSISLNFKNEHSDHSEKPYGQSIYTKYAINKNRAYRCQVAWTPIMDDEINLNLGDFVCVKEIFDDGYCLGRNLSTKFYGIFPTCCLARSNELLMGSDLIEDGIFVSVLKRTSSKNKVSKRNGRATLSVVIPSWNHNDLNSILTQ